MDLQLSGKKALVTGSTAGIGFGIAKALAAEGAHVYVNGRTKARVDQAVQQIRAAVPQAQVEGIALDLASAEAAEQLIQQLPAVDILINNLGIFEVKPFLEITDEDWKRFFETNVLSGARLSRIYLPGMLKQNWGRIIFISSESSIQIPVEMVHYGMTKTAQVAVARGIAQSVSGTGVTVNSVLPGPTRSEGVERFLEGMAQQKKQSTEEVEKSFFKTARPTSLLQRFATVEEVANMVTYVASPLSIATNGAALRVDGGTANTLF